MRIPRTVYLSSQVLLAAGAFVQGALFDLPTGTISLTFSVRYTPGAAGGRPEMRISWGNAVDPGSGFGPGEISRDVLVDGSSLIVATPNAEVSVYASEVIGPVSVGVFDYVVKACVPGGMTQFRFDAAEKGIPATPGTIQVTFTGSG